MEMSEARLQLASANEELIKARVQIHEFKPASLEAPVNAGLAAAKKSYEMGVAGMHERDVRRRGLMISLAAILATIAGLWLTIRRIERPRPE
jgi:hypothetical protein